MSLHRYRNEKGEEVFDAKELMQTLHEGDMISFAGVMIGCLIGTALIPFVSDYVVPFVKILMYGLLGD